MNNQQKKKPSTLMGASAIKLTDEIWWECLSSRLAAPAAARYHSIQGQIAMAIDPTLSPLIRRKIRDRLTEDRDHLHWWWVLSVFYTCWASIVGQPDSPVLVVLLFYVMVENRWTGVKDCCLPLWFFHCLSVESAPVFSFDEKIIEETLLTLLPSFKSQSCSCSLF